MDKQPQYPATSKVHAQVILPLAATIVGHWKFSLVQHVLPSYPAQTVETDTSRDEQLARELQAQFNRSQGGGYDGGAPVVAAPAMQVPYSCGACGTTHAVRNVTHGAVFKCTVCGTANRIMLQQHRPVVVVDNAYPVPIPIFCNIL